MFDYSKLFSIMKERNITKVDLGSDIGLSSRTIAKLSKGESVSMETIYSICRYLHCQPGDIMEIKIVPQKGTVLSVLFDEMEHKIKGGLYHQVQVEMAYNSNHMEGSTLTEEQTRNIYETNTIGLDEGISKVDDIIETVNHFKAFDYIIKNATELLNENNIKELHKILKSNTSQSRLDWFNVGDYKLKPNKVGDMETVDPKNVSMEMNKLLKEYNKNKKHTFEELLDFHHRFESIHPFQDGNGRVGRLILFKECLRNDIVPFIIKDDIRLYYYRGLKQWKNDRAYLLDTCLSCQDYFKNMLKYFRIEY